MSSCEYFAKITGNCNKVERCAETGLCIFIVLYDMGHVWSVCAPFRVPKAQLQQLASLVHFGVLHGLPNIPLQAKNGPNERI